MGGWTRLTALIVTIGALCAVRAEAQTAPLRVVATFSILADLARNVGGEKVAVTTLVGPDADAHTYQPTPSDARAVAEADVLITNGLGLEGWLVRLKGAAKSKAIVVVASAGVKALTMAEKAERGKPAETDDPHAWQSLANGQTYVANIAASFAEADAPNADFYRRSGAAYANQLAALDDKIKAELAAVPKAKRRVITTHDSFRYFGKAYDINFIAPLGISTENEPSAGDIAKLERQIKRENIRALFLENVTNARLIAQIAKDTGAVVGPSLYSDALSKPDEPAATYLKMFEHNAAVLKEGMLKN